MARTAKDHAEVIFSGILPDRLDLLYKAQRQISIEHFVDPFHRHLWTMIDNYLSVCSGVIKKADIEDILENKTDSGSLALILELYDTFAERQVSESDVLWSFEQLREWKAEKETAEAINEAMQILTTGGEDLKGNKLQGQTAARDYLMGKLSDINKTLYVNESPEGNIREEQEDILADYEEQERKRIEGTSVGILSGIPELDDRLGGFHNGDLTFVVGYAGTGKSSFATVQVPWYASVVQGKNVVVLTTETSKDQLRRRILARHSRQDCFGIREGLNSRDIKLGRLNDVEKMKFREVVSDFTTNTAYGRCHIVQVPRGANLTDLEARLNRLQKDFNVDLVIMDYLALLKPTRGRGTDREELVSIVKEAKEIATTFDSGRGVPFISPWQVRREAMLQAQKLGQYTLDCMADTAEVERTADIAVSLLETTTRDNPRYVSMKLQGLKVRDGESGFSVSLDADYATSYFYPSMGLGDSSVDSLLDL